MAIVSQFKKGTLELCCLHLIHEKDCYGYELAQQVSTYIKVGEGVIYPILRRLVSDGWCTTYLQDSSEGPSRKYYQITAAGEQHLQVLTKEWQQFTQQMEELLTGGKANE